MFYTESINNKTFLKSDIIKAEHFFTTRNSILQSKDSETQAIIEENRNNLCKYLHILRENLISPTQTHTSNIGVATAGITEYPETDALIVNSNDIAIFLNFADCTPIIFYDDIKNIGAVVHAGWRGTAGNIATKTITQMINHFGCSPKNISAAIGAAIGLCCYNVGEDVYNKLKLTVNDFSGLSKSQNGEIFVDLKAINARQIQECGVEKIDIAPFCTCCNNDLFFSYRKENATTNRHSAVLKIN